MSALGALLAYVLLAFPPAGAGEGTDRAITSVLEQREQFHQRWLARHHGGSLLELRPFPVSRLEYVFWLEAFLREHRRGPARTLALLAYFEIQSWQYGGLLDAEADEARAAELLGRLTLTPETWRLAPDAFLPAVLAAGGNATLARRLAPDAAVRDAVEQAIWMDAWWRGDALDLPEDR